mgnify:CR=1 FL=1
MKKTTTLDKLTYVTQAILVGISVYLLFVDPQSKEIHFPWGLILLACMINIILIYVNRKYALIYTWLITSGFILYYFFC